MRGDERRMSPGKTVSVQRPVDERLVQCRELTPDVDIRMERAVADYLFGENHGLNEEEIVRCAFVYAKGYKEGVETTK